MAASVLSLLHPLAESNYDETHLQHRGFLKSIISAQHFSASQNKKSIRALAADGESIWASESISGPDHEAIICES